MQPQKKSPRKVGFFVDFFEEIFGGATQSRTGLDGFAIRCITALLSRLISNSIDKKGKHQLPIFLKDHVHLSVTGAGNETRTRDLNLGKVALYQLSYSRKLTKKTNLK
jgi:hypothetical protein